MHRVGSGEGVGTFPAAASSPPPPHSTSLVSARERCALCQAWRCEWSMAGKCCERDQGEEVGKSGAGGGGALVAVVPRDDRRKTLKPDDEDGIAQRESRGQGGGRVKSRARRDVAERVVVASTKGQWR
ncbi:unnamed protein product [Lampetra fluviatilis]